MKMSDLSMYDIFVLFLVTKYIDKVTTKAYETVYTGCLETGGTSGKGMILREKRSRKYKIKIFRLRLCFRENRI